ncbi:TOBE domain-containing protein [Rhizobium etli]|uniref:TOBE domain-containing protein n=1 Tax=Rhizobium TaxID=379 RepID=UPI0009D7417E
MELHCRGQGEFVIAADRVSLSTPAAQDSVTNGVNGSVIGIEFVGSTQTIFFDVNGHEFRVQKQQHEIDALDLTPGKRLALSWQPQHAWLLPEAA